MKHVFYAIAGLVIVLVGAVFLSRHDSISESQPIRIGVSTVLSGDLASLGEGVVDSAQIAVKQINTSGGINGRQVVLDIQDAGLDSKTGLSAAQKLVNSDGVKYIIGGTSSNGTLAAAPLMNDQHIVYMTPVTGGTNIDHAGEYIFRTANSDLLAGRDLANAALKLGFKNVAVVAEVTDYTLDIRNTFDSTMVAGGGAVILSEEYQPNTTDFRTLVAKVKAAKPQAILILSQTGLGGAHFVQQAKVAGITVPFFSDFTFLLNDSAKQVIGSFDGIYFADPAYDAGSPEVQNFLKKYQDTYQRPPTIEFQALSTYDSVMMLATALRAEGDDSIKVHDWLLSNVKNYHGLMGTYSLDAGGNSDLGFVIKVVKGGQFLRVQ